MVSKTQCGIFAFGLVTLASATPAATQAAEMLDVTFTVPIQIQNIHSNWSKVGVFCSGGMQMGIKIPRGSNFLIGTIDVSNKARGSINQTVSGTIQLTDTSSFWACELAIQYTGESDFRPGLTEITGSSVTKLGGQF
jgi:hypothetical protein